MMTGTRAGYIRLYRRLFENPVWTTLDPPVLKVFLAFLLKANWKTSAWYHGKTMVEIPRGSFITSYGSMALFTCLTEKQVRLAFTHLANLGIAAYSRAPRWTVVRVLNYETYQPSNEEEGTLEQSIGQGEGHPNDTGEGTLEDTTEVTLGDVIKLHANNDLQAAVEVAGQGGGHNVEQAARAEQGRMGGGQRATDEEVKKVRRKDPPYPGVNGAVAPAESVPPDTNGNLGTSPTKRRPYRGVLEQVAISIHGRHPNEHGRRDLSVTGVQKKLEAILQHKHIPGADCEAYLHRIDSNHMAACESESWRKEDGQYVKGLRNWLAPTEDRYDFEPAVPARKGPVRLTA
jgi:hypothetical protein